MTEIGGGAAASPDTDAYIEAWKNTLGLAVEVKQMDAASFYQDQQAGKLQMFGSGWVMDYPDPEDLLDLKFHSKSPLNDQGYNNPAVDKILDDARSQADANKRLDLYRQAEKQILQDAAVVPLYFEEAHQVVSPAIKGWFNPLPRVSWKIAAISRMPIPSSRALRPTS